MTRSLILLAVPLLMSIGWTSSEAAAGSPRVSPRARKAALQAQHRQIVRKLNLTAEQRQKIAAYKAEHRKKIAEIDAALHVKRVELENEMAKPEPDQAKVAALTGEIGQLKASRDLQRLKARKALDEILTPEQRDELRRMQQESNAGGSDPME